MYIAENKPKIKIKIRILVSRSSFKDEKYSLKTKSAAYAPQKSAAPMMIVENNKILASE